tara:strand:+ start:5309 stop:5509 length:201 start_codon:yes stop_codon:yes gene_type:complete
MDSTDQLAQLFQKYNANEEQSKIMAKQLIKRAKQISNRDGIPEVDALNTLLTVTIRGLNGLGPEGK